ncbi:MAG: IS5 family transposase ISDds9 [Haliscomenobacter sp.]|nr:IS5 family transposase ISDds9 [Haliscomenobacter sp.]
MGQLAPVFETPYKGTGCPCQDARLVLNGILWIFRTGAPWKDLPERYPPHQTCHRRYQEWVDRGVFDLALQLLTQDLLERGHIDVQECFIDGSFTPSKKGAQVLAKLSGVRAPRSWQLQMSNGFPIAIDTGSASPHEVTLVEQTLEARFINEIPKKLIGDKAYDSDTLDEQMEEDTVLK